MMMRQRGVGKEDFKQYEVQLMKYKRIVLSNRHLKELYNDDITKKKMFQILFELNREEVMSMATSVGGTAFDDDKESGGKEKGFKETEKVYLNISNESWKCMLFISWLDIQNLRNWMEGYEIRNGRIDWRKCEKVMIRELEFEKNSTVNLLSDDEEEQDQKKEFTFKFRNTKVSPFPVNVHVFSKVQNCLVCELLEYFVKLIQRVLSNIKKNGNCYKYKKEYELRKKRRVN